jgi:Fe-S cluster biosynthesis and repair protein YggX
MSNIIHCIKLNQDLPALDSAPLPGELGEKILRNVSAQAWDLWVGQQTMLINENRLSVIDPDARQLLEKAMIEFLCLDKADS